MFTDTVTVSDTFNVACIGYRCHTLLELLTTAWWTYVLVASMPHAWWLSDRFSALRPEGRRFESHSSRDVETLGKSFTQSCL